MRKSPKAKEPVRVRYKKLANGNLSAYLDIYVKGNRHTEFLKIYIIPEKTPNDKLQNSEALKTINAIKSQRVIEIVNNEYGISQSQTRAKMLFSDWFVNVMETKKEGTKRTYQSILKHLLKFDSTITLANIDEVYLNKFVSYLAKEVNNNTCLMYIAKVKLVVTKAVKEGILSRNPFDKINKDLLPKATKANRGFLDIEEVKSLINTEYTNPNVKKAFLFSCFTGLRFSDIQSLTFSDILDVNGQKYISIQMIKTKENINIPLSENALKFIDFEGKNNGDLVFVLPTLVSINDDLKIWAKKANITKNLSFHIARHTFATLHLNLGADVYTISKLLGHTNIKTTQIYADIVNKTKIDAVNLTNGVF